MELTSYDGKKVEFTTELSQNQMFPQSSYIEPILNHNISSYHDLWPI